MIMHKYMKTLLAAGVVAAAGLSAAEARDLTVVGFGGAVQDAFREAYFTPYAKEKGITVLEDTTNGGLAKQKAMVEAGNVTWDVMQMEDDEVTMACEQGLLEDMDWSTRAHADEIDPSQFKDCAVGALSWANILTYDASKLTDGPKNWADFWNVEKWPGKRGLRKTAKLTMEVALMADGVAPADVYKVIATKEGQDRAFAKLDELKPHIQWWESGAQPQEWLSSGDVVMTSAYNGRVDNAQKEGKNFPIIWDGQINSVEFWAVMKGTPNLDQSIAFVEFLMSKDPQVTFANAIAYGVSNVKAMEALPADRLAKLPSAPDNLKNAVRFNSEFWIDHGEELAERFASWVAQ
ncbi:MAG TPA: ABC transporter substrate-binding protein [Shinella sp.]|uniref:ABC transporter substrate-binding protein n=1 Tax=Shinella sp. TaxID=1870904 RepID=UPI002E0FAD5E|nr:ABC transporter substrate-binding protein [Shinella sp.]